MDFAQFLKAFDELVARARKGTISPDDFMGTTISLTNPGTVGTTASAPRLMPGQGSIVATGAIDYPPSTARWRRARCSLLGISKVMTMTSTYDHRIIQGAESGAVPRRAWRSCCAARTASTSGSSRTSQSRTGRCSWEIDENPGLFGARRAASEEIAEAGRVLQLINAYRVRGHLVADLDPLGVDARAAPRARSRDLRPDHLGPRPRVHHRTASRGTATSLPPCARSWRSCATPTAEDRRRVHAHRRTASTRTGCRSGWSRRATAWPSTPRPAAAS